MISLACLYCCHSRQAFPTGEKYTDWDLREVPLFHRIPALAGVFLLFTSIVLGQQSSAPLTLTLQDALSRARANSVQFQAALTDQGVAHEDKAQARAGLLPSVNFN